MHLFFDIFHKGELFLDETGAEFASLDHAHDYLIHTLREFRRLGGHPSDFVGYDATIDITDRAHVRRVVAMRDSMDELVDPVRHAA
ncbi:MAG: DUF6894 family protein [Hyphomicrobiaceae bacterium]